MSFWKSGSGPTKAACLDEEVGIEFLEEQEITVEDLKQAIRRQTIGNKFVPVVGGSAFKNKGVQYLLDAVVDYLPGPLDVAATEGLDPNDHSKTLEAISLMDLMCEETEVEQGLDSQLGVATSRQRLFQISDTP